MMWIIPMTLLVLFGMFLDSILDEVPGLLRSRHLYHRMGGAIAYSLIAGSIFSIGVLFISNFWDNPLTFGESWLWTVGLLFALSALSAISGPIDRPVDPSHSKQPREIDEDLILELEAESKERRERMVSKRDAGAS